MEARGWRLVGSPWDRPCRRVQHVVRAARLAGRPACHLGWQGQQRNQIIQVVVCKPALNDELVDLIGNQRAMLRPPGGLGIACRAALLSQAAVVQSGAAV